MGKKGKKISCPPDCQKKILDDQKSPPTPPPRVKWSAPKGLYFSDGCLINFLEFTAHLYKFQATILARLLIIGKFNFHRKISKAAVILEMEVVIIRNYEENLVKPKKLSKVKMMNRRYVYRQQNHMLSTESGQFSRCSSRTRLSTLD